jgi:LPS-assembly protein
MKNSSIFFVSAILLFLANHLAVAQEELSGIPAFRFVSGTEPVYFSGDRFTYDLKTGIVTGTGDVEIVQQESELRGDRVVLDLSKKLAEIEGNVVATRLGDVVEGDKGIYDLETEEGIFYGARGHSEPWYVSADHVEREIHGEYSIGVSTLTTCNLPHPHYRLQANSVTVVPDDRLAARDLFLYAGPVPVFYFPYYAQGLHRRPPVEFTAGSQSDLGVYARVGYNLEVSDEILLNPHVWGFTKSGVGGGLDGRLNLFDGDGRGRFDSFYISDQNDDNTDEVGIDKDRGKADLYYRQELPYDLTALLQTEYISDREFLKTFDFDDYRKRELPETFFNLERTGEHSVASLIVRENLVDYTEDVDRLPAIRLELLEQELGDTGIYFNAMNEAAYLKHDPRGPESARNFSEVRLSYPARLLQWLSLVPFLEGDGTYYSKTPIEDDEYRVSGSTGIVGQSRFQKVYGSPFAQYSAFRHLIVPTVTYRFRPTPDDEPEDLYQFDSIDLIDRENMVELELRNYLQGKRPDGSKVDLLEHILTAGLEFDDGEDKLASLENEILIRPVRKWEFAFKSVNDFRDIRRADLVSGVVRYAMAESFTASVGAIHEDTVLKPYSTQAVYALSKAFGPLWRVGFEQRYDFADSEFSYHEFWLWRDLHCWELLLNVQDRQEATEVMVLFNIKAFPMSRIEREIALKPIGEKDPWPTRW